MSVASGSISGASERSSGTAPAPEGQVWVCAACGKTSRTRYGMDADGRRVAGVGWDASCVLNAVLCYERVVGDATYKAVS